jgi:hypothetical protein
VADAERRAEVAEDAAAKAEGQLQSAQRAQAAAPPTQLADRVSGASGRFRSAHDRQRLIDALAEVAVLETAVKDLRERLAAAESRARHAGMGDESGQSWSSSAKTPGSNRAERRRSARRQRKGR